MHLRRWRRRRPGVGLAGVGVGGDVGGVYCGLASGETCPHALRDMGACLTEVQGRRPPPNVYGLVVNPPQVLR